MSPSMTNGIRVAIPKQVTTERLALNQSFDKLAPSLILCTGKRAGMEFRCNPGQSDDEL